MKLSLDNRSLLVNSSGGAPPKPPDCSAQEVSVYPPDIPFGKVKLGFSSSRSMTITNKGKCEINVKLSVPPEFYVSRNPFPIKPGKSETISVTFRPAFVHIQTSRINISPGTTSVLVSGEGTPK